MRPNRRQFLKSAAAAGVAATFPARRALAFYQSPAQRPRISLFGTKLRGVGPGGIPVAAPDATPAPVTGVTHYTIDINQFQDPGVCPQLGATTLWGYHPRTPLGGAQAQTHLGGIIVAQKGVPVQVTFKNNLNVANHIIPVDSTIPGANQAINRTAVHMHGGKVPWISDGGPFDWFDPRGMHGDSFLNNATLNPNAGAGEAEYYYPNDQSSRLVWYHDHAYGITRINAYAGIATGYVIRDAFEIGLKNLGLPEFIENSVLGGKPVRELPLVFQDKVFVGDNIQAVDRFWTGVPTPGSLWYAHTYEPDRWELGPTLTPPPDPSVVAEFFGDTMLVNGTVFPKATVEAGRYRLRLLNACNARVLNLQLYVADGSKDGITLDRYGNPRNEPFLDEPTGRPNVLQIGTDGGLLPKPVRVATNVPFNPVTLGGSLIFAGGERADILLDFKSYVGKSIILYNDAPAPFPSGDPRNDYFPRLNVADNPVNGVTVPGNGPNTRILMRFDVVAASFRDAPLKIDTRTDLRPGNAPLLVPMGVNVPPLGVKTRQLTLNEDFDTYGRLIQLCGTAEKQGAGFGRTYLDTPTETVNAGDIEVWEIFNLTGDVHPIHPHLVDCQIINRQAFSELGLRPSGPAVPPDPNEAGWKDTIRMYPGTVTRIIMKFDLAPIQTSKGKPVDVPLSSRTGGHEYVWHCHILEHEEHDMMRPLVVL